MALATLADYQNITGTSFADGDSPERYEKLLVLASSAVLAGAHGQQIKSAPVADELVHPYEGVMYLTQRPVTEITSVVVGGVTLGADDYRFTPGGGGRPAKLIRRVDGVDAYWGTDHHEATVTYVAGYDPVPGQVITMVCAMVKATIDNDGGAQSTQETAGPFSESWSDPQQAGMALTDSARGTLDALCKVRGFGSVPIMADR